jgi:hypothetical protein
MVWYGTIPYTEVVQKINQTVTRDKLKIIESPKTRGVSTIDRDRTSIQTGRDRENGDDGNRTINE